MKVIYSAIALASLSVLPLACNESQKGGVVNSNREGTGTRETFTIKAPSGTTSIKQGDKQTVKISLDRASNFKQSVKLEATAPKGIKVEPSSITIQASDGAETSVAIEVDRDAALGEQIVKITGTPASGAATSVDVKIKVEENKK
ncbi:hypothetical protein KIH39_11910 [Telmatocola sphagniphila]|uniref:Lipoprotein n=1 Tax=Telmatocola sphagniphila TaxID=1123043 RepID=A0A8E6BA56_9BACT|nr:hypothetical protein [Telmatocola sphagniphila]QVL34576.1 hypothetical protein KIH39_11910 [Telmatocola sphagniphila]